MIPFQIHMKLKSPLIMFRYPPSLASIVWNCLFFHLRDEVKAKAQLFSIFKSTEEVLHASNLFFVVSPHQTLIAKSHTKVGAMHYEKDLNQFYCKPNGRKDTYTKLLVSGGPYKNRFRLLESFHSPRVLFYGFGDIERIVNLLNFYLLGVGAEVNSGSGQVDDIRWNSIENDYSLIGPDHLPARPIPVSVYNRMKRTESNRVNIELCNYSHPYRLGGKSVLCAMNERIKRIVI